MDMTQSQAPDQTKPMTKSYVKTSYTYNSYITLYVNALYHFHTSSLCKTDLYEYLIIVINYQEYLSFCICYMMSTMLSCTISTRLSFILLMRSNISFATANIKRYSRPNILYLKKINRSQSGEKGTANTLYSFNETTHSRRKK